MNDRHDPDLDELRPLIEELFAGLETLPYHVFLGVSEHAEGDDLRVAFHRRARALHPDRFYGLDDEPLRRKVYAVYKRVAEAYRVLGDPESRRRYEAQRRHGAIRLDPTERPAGPPRPEDAVEGPARKYYRLALQAERRGDLKSAKLNAQLAWQLAPGNEVLKQMLEKYA